MSEVLVGDDVRARLFAALDGVRVACGVPPAVWARVRLAIQLHPLAVKVIKPPRDGSRAEELGVLDLRTLPDRGAALSEAVEDFAAGGLAGLSQDAQAAVLVNAAGESGRGGLYLAVDPGDEGAVLAHTLPGRSLGEGIVLGGILAAPETAH